MTDSRRPWWRKMLDLGHPLDEMDVHFSLVFEMALGLFFVVGIVAIVIFLFLIA